jgi:TatD DNase family protein
VTSYVDSHCHLDIFPDPIRTLDDAPNTIVIAVSELPSRYRLLSARFRRDRRVRVALGLHPLRAATAGPLEEGQLIRQLATAEYVGEVGLDFSKHGRDSKDAQLRIFDRLLAEPVLKHKVVTVHSRGAERVTIERLSEAGVVGVLHWYTGPPTLVDQALAAGLYFSVNPAMLRTEKGQQTIASLPRERVLTESDGPFAKIRGHNAAPSDMPSVIAHLARTWGAKPDDVRRAVHDNLAALYAATVTAASRPSDPSHPPLGIHRPTGVGRDN